MDRLRAALIEVVGKGAANSRNVQLALIRSIPRRAWASTPQLRPVLRESLQHVLERGTLEQGAEVVGSEST
eukprot:13201277-Alexandrium_andersonii.AAC.1